MVLKFKRPVYHTRVHIINTGRPCNDLMENLGMDSGFPIRMKPIGLIQTFVMSSSPMTEVMDDMRSVGIKEYL